MAGHFSAGELGGLGLGDRAASPARPSHPRLQRQPLYLPDCPMASSCVINVEPGPSSEADVLDLAQPEEVRLLGENLCKHTLAALKTCGFERGSRFGPST